MKGGDSGGERCGGDKEEGEEVTNEPKLIDFSFSRDHSVQWSVLSGFRVLKWRDNGRVTPGAAALQTRPSEKSQPCSQYFLDAGREKDSVTAQAQLPVQKSSFLSSNISTLFSNSRHEASHPSNMKKQRNSFI